MNEIIMLLGFISSLPFCAIKNNRCVVRKGIIKPIMPTDRVDSPIITYIKAKIL